MFLGINTEQNDLEESERKYSGWKVVRSLSVMGSQGNLPIAYVVMLTLQWA